MLNFYVIRYFTFIWLRTRIWHSRIWWWLFSSRNKRQRQQTTSRLNIPTTRNKYSPLATTTTTTTPTQAPPPRGAGGRGRGMRTRNRNTRLLLDEGSPSVHFLAGLLDPTPNLIPSPGSPPEHLMILESGEEESRRASSSSSSSSMYNFFNLHTPSTSSSSNVSRQVSNGSISVTDSSSDLTGPDKCDPRLCKLNLIEQ